MNARSFLCTLHLSVRPLAVLVLGALVFLLATSQAQAQPGTDSTVVVAGKTVDASDQSPLPGVTVLLTSQADSTRQYGSVADAEGNFSVRVPRAGTYRLRFSMIGYRTQEQTITLAAGRRNLGTIAIEEDKVLLDQVVVEGTQTRVEVKGDTTIYNADAFKVNRDASAEELVAKMPGITVQDGQVQARGEAIRRVLVDGEEFFGEDATLALRNLPAEIIEKVQVYERLSDQARFTGFDDGSGEQTINIVTRPGMNAGQFGKAYGGYGSDTRYQGGGNVNFFDGARRISVIGMTNNVNQQNFATEDLLGVVSAGGGRGGRGGGGPRGGGGGPRGGGGGWGGGGDMRNFLTGQQGGINLTNAIGVNYSDRWGEKMRVTGSYFFNHTSNNSDVLLDRQYFLTEGEMPFYNENSTSESQNYNHRLNGRLQYEINERNSLIFTPRLSLQGNGAESFMQGSNRLNGLLLNQTVNNYTSDNLGYSAASNLLWRHSFEKRGRTFSANLGLNFNDRRGDTEQYALNTYYEATGTPDEVQAYDQFIESLSWGRTVSANLNFTEPLFEGSQLQLSYNPSFSSNASDRNAFLRDEATGGYTLPDAAFSSAFDYSSVTQRAGLSFRVRKEKYNFMLGLNVQEERLSGDQSYPSPFEVNETYRSLLPSAMFEYEPTDGREIRLFYRASTNTPSVNQLQPVLNNTNPLFLSSGNPDLRPSFNHSLSLRMNATDAEGGRSFFGFVSVSRNENYIGNASLIARRDTMLAPGVLLAQGGQYNFPVNMDGYWSARSFMTVGFPFPFIKSNLNVNAGLSYARTPALINDQQNTSDVYDVNGGVVIGSNISERLDFTLSYSLSYNVVTSSLYDELDQNYLRHRGNARFTWLPTESLVLESNLSTSHYNGLNRDLYPSRVMWNAGVGYKFLAGNAGELKLLVTDLLNQTETVSRTMNELYIENSETQVLGRYVMLNFTYRIKNFRF